MLKALLLAIFLLITSIASADVYIIYNTDTKEIASMQDDDSAVLEKGFTKKIIEGKHLSDYQFQYDATYYKYLGNKIIVNTSKLSEEEGIVNKSKKIAEEQALIDKKLRDMAIDSLKSEGINFMHLKKSNE